MDAGHLFVAAAGNDGIDNDNVVQPARPCSYDLDNIICVGAVDSADQRASFGDNQLSNYGATTVDLWAPGDSIITTKNRGGYEYFGMTSGAAPHVTGVAALLMSRYGWDWRTVRQRIFDTVRPVPELATGFTPAPTVTGGVLNALQAMSIDCNENLVAGHLDIAWGDSMDCLAFEST